MSDQRPSSAGRRVVAVITTLPAAGAELVAGFRDRGATALLVDPGSDLDRGLAAASDDHGPIDLVVCAMVDPAGTVPLDLADTDETTWAERAEAPVLATLHCFQAAFSHLRRPGGSIAVLVPTLCMHGAAGLVGWATAAEGQRSLAKATARQWGRQGLTINCVAVPGGLLAAAGAAGAAASPATAGIDRPTPPAAGAGAGSTEDLPFPALDRPGLPLPALGHLPQLRSEVVAAIDAVCTGAAALTGLTVAVDGGVWMTP